VLLFAHNSREPIGIVEPIEVEGKRLIAHAKLAKEGSNPVADVVWAMIEQDMLRASSVGFMPTKDPNPIWRDDDEDSGILTGFEFVGQELLELSVVSVPANPNALALAKGFALSPDQLRSLFTDDGSAARIAMTAARGRNLTLTRLGRHQAAPLPKRGD